MEEPKQRKAEIRKRTIILSSLSPQWFYQRLNGSAANGKPVKSNESELKTLANTLTDISKKISQAAALVL